MIVIGPVLSRCHEGSPLDKSSETEYEGNLNPLEPVKLTVWKVMIDVTVVKFRMND